MTATPRPPVIVGAGLAGLIAAHAWPSSDVLEASDGPRAAHAALLRFRSNEVARAVGIEFRKVRVRKGIFHDGAFVQPDIRVANLYSRKVLAAGRIEDRSIWSLEPVDRWIAPETFYWQLVDSLGSRIQWGVRFDWKGWRERESRAPAISTAPLVATAAEFYSVAELPEFRRAPILVQRFRVPNSDVHQTVYFPTERHSVYRASITGSLLIVEHAGLHAFGPWAEDVHEAFALRAAVEIDAVEQSYGKISPIPDDARRALLFRLTHEHSIYSLGRFATWRNILLDDVVNDIAVIKRLLRSSTYEVKRHAAGT